MELKNKVEKILSKYDLDVDIPDDIYKNRNEEERKDLFKKGEDARLCEKYKDKIPRGWYGFSIGTPVPDVWIKAIEKVLDFLIKKDDTFEIHQIKMKFGGIRFYVVSSKIEDLLEIELLIENSMFNENLIY